MKFGLTSEQKWVIGALTVIVLGAAPSFWMSPGNASSGSSASSAAGESVVPKGDAVPILESEWAPRSMSGEEQQALQETLKVDINHINEEGLVDAHLPGIGAGTAAKLIAYREARGCFQDIEEIRNVKGLGGDAKYDALKDYIRADVAGCVFKDADAQEISDPSQKSSRSKKKSGGGQSSRASLVNINTATAAELVKAKLPGVGKKTAERIIEYRNENGSFGSLEDLMQVEGITEGKFEKFKDLITLN